MYLNNVVKNKTEHYSLWIAAGLFLCVMLVVEWFNFFALPIVSNTDAVGEMVYAKMVWEEKSIFPVDYFPATEAFTMNPALLTAIIYGMCNNLKLAHSFTMLICGIILNFAYYKLLRVLEIKNDVALLIMALTWSCFPQAAMFTILGENTYASFWCVIFVTLISWYKPTMLRRIITSGLAIWCGLASARMLVFLYGPLLLIEIGMLLYCRKKDIRPSYSISTIIWVMCCCILNSGAYFLLKKWIAPHYHWNFSMQHLGITPNLMSSFKQLLSNLALGLGYIPNAPIINVIIFVVCACGFGCYFYYLHKMPKVKETWKLFLFFPVAESIITISSFLSGIHAPRYHITCVFMILVGIALLLNRIFWNFSKMIFFIVPVIVILGGWGIYSSSYVLRKPDSALIKVVDTLVKDNFSRIYATYWNAGPIMLHSNWNLKVAYLQPWKPRLSPFLWSGQKSVFARKFPLENSLEAIVLTQVEIDDLTMDEKGILSRGKLLSQIGAYSIFVYDRPPVNVFIFPVHPKESYWYDMANYSFLSKGILLSDGSLKSPSTDLNVLCFWGNHFAAHGTYTIHLFYTASSDIDARMEISTHNGSAVVNSNVLNSDKNELVVKNLSLDDDAIGIQLFKKKGEIIIRGFSITKEPEMMGSYIVRMQGAHAVETGPQGDFWQWLEKDVKIEFINNDGNYDYIGRFRFARGNPDESLLMVSVNGENFVYAMNQDENIVEIPFHIRNGNNCVEFHTDGQEVMTHGRDSRHLYMRLVDGTVGDVLPH